MSDLTVTHMGFPDVLVIKAKTYEDDRGYFYEAWNQHSFDDSVGARTWCQDNVSRSKRGVLRGLHYQLHHPQGKLIRVLDGKIYDVVVDLRTTSETFGKWASITLSDPYTALWVPEGFAHGFYVLSEVAEVMYKTTEFRYAGDERVLRWNSPTLNIQWPIEECLAINERDKSAPVFGAAEVYR